MSKIYWNPDLTTLYKVALNQGCLLSERGALIAYSGEKTGRSPKDKRIVKNNKSENIWWGDVNIPLEQNLFNCYAKCSKNILFAGKELFCVDAFACWNKSCQIKVRVWCKEAYHCLFMMNMLIPSPTKFDKVDFVIYNVGSTMLGELDKELDKSNLEKDVTLTDTLVAIDLESMEIIIYGTRYAGEMKKGILTLFMYMMPLENSLCLHSSATISNDFENVVMYFGLSGTGKTTLSSSQSGNCLLIGDDEFVWNDTGISNIEGGCYAKCINLSRENEPDIYDALKFGSVLENVDIVDSRVHFDSHVITKNTRGSYPLNYIPNVMIPAFVNKHPTEIIFLTCDAMGLFPPISKLNKEQISLFFVTGYTSKVAGTEMGIKEPQPVFSACFGEPFIIWNPSRYAELLVEKLEKHKCNVWLLNTGWVRGAYGTGHRILLKHTRKMVEYILDKQYLLDKFEKYSIFDFEIPCDINNFIFMLQKDKDMLFPKKVWNDKQEYDVQIKKLLINFKDEYHRKIS